MLENFKKITNPLTIIGIFAGLAEITSTITIKLVTNDIQKIFIWFLILFPSILVILFFIVLFFKPEALYSPSDYKSDEAFIKVILGNNEKILKTLNSLDSEKEQKNQKDYITEIKSSINSSNELLNFLNIKGMSESEYNVYSCISNSDSGLKSIEISEQLGVSLNSTKRILNKLIASGHIVNENGVLKSTIKNNFKLTPIK